MKVLILGGSGFIGSYLSDILVKSGHAVTIFHQPGASRKNVSQIEKEVRFIEGDFHNSDDIGKAVKGAQVVVHLISSTLPGSSLSNPIYDVETNVVGSIALFDHCVKAGVKKVVFVSSGGTVYGIPRQCPIIESHPLDPISPYGISKMTIEKFLGMYHYHYGLDYTVLRISNPFGARQDPGRGQGVMAAWMHKISRGEPIEIWGDGSIIRDYICVEDAVRALELAMFTQTEEKIFNVGSGRGYSLTDLHHLMESQIGKPIPVRFKEMQKVDVPVNILDITLINKTLGWQPQIEVGQGIKRMWDTFIVR